MELAIQKWGNSAAVRLPTELLGLLKAALGDKLSVEVHPDGIVLRTKRKVYSLAELVAQCDTNAEEPEDMAIWNTLKPMGREVW